MRGFLSLAAAALVAASAGISCGHGDPAAGAIERVKVSGQHRFADGSFASVESVQYQVLLIGEDLFARASGGCGGVPPHSPGSSFARGKPGTSGSYSFEIAAKEVRAAVAPGCSLEAIDPARVKGIRINASILADAASCDAFCRASGDASPDCRESCSTGNRIIQASRTLTAAETAAVIEEARRSGSGTLAIEQPLVFSSLGPPLTEGLGADLRPDAESPRTTAHVAREEFSASACEADLACVRAPGTRTLLRFDAVVANLGTSDLVLGSPSDPGEFEFDSCHQHYHLRDVLLYELIDPRTGRGVEAEGQQVVGRKTGFCMMDILQVNASAPQGGYDCDYQGLTVGWGDIYESSLECQFLDVTGVPPGSYSLRITANPDGKFPESDTSNNTVEVPVSIPAQPEGG